MRVFNPARLRAALKAWKRAEPGRFFHQVSGAVGVDAKTLSNWKTGATVPDANELLKLMAVLGVGPNDLSDPAD